MYRYVLILMAMIAMAGTLFATVVGDEFFERINTTESEVEALGVIKDFLPRISDLEDYRMVQNVWLKLDAKACHDFFQKLFADNPQSAMHHYLWARALSDNTQSLLEGRIMVVKYPDFSWGYRLVVAAYVQGLFNDMPDYVIDRELLDRDFERDKAILLEAYTRFPDEEYYSYAAYKVYMHQKNYPDAEKILLIDYEELPAWLSDSEIYEFTSSSKRSAAWKKLLPLFLDGAVKSGELESSNYQVAYHVSYLALLADTELWEDMRSYLDEHPEIKDIPYLDDILLKLYAATQDADSAVATAQKILKARPERYLLLKNDPNLAFIATHPIWKSELARADSLYQSQAAERKAKILGEIVEKPAYMWELSNAEGDTIRLVDQKGKIVILDFWATWCGPCRSAMPVLDKWTKEEKPEGVEVFSINVWERDPSKAKAYMEEQGFAMTLLHGDDSLSQDYGFDGIPFICVIDQEGKIRFEESGYSPDLGEKLSVWVEALSR